MLASNRFLGGRPARLGALFAAAFALIPAAAASAAPTVSVNDVSVTEGNSSFVLATFTVSLSEPSSSTVSVGTNTATGTASTFDFNMRPSTTLTFNPGVTSRTINVAVNGDTRDEFDETYFLDLSNAVNATIADSRGVGTITDDDAAPTISINDVSVDEPNNGNTLKAFTVSLSAASGKPVAVDTTTAAGTASVFDFNMRPTTTLSFAPGATSRTINVAVNGDTMDEFDETYFMDLVNPSNATISDSRGIGTIVDNDAAPTVSIADVVVTEPASGQVVAQAAVTLSAPSGKPVTVRHDSVSGSATGGSDYFSRTGNVVTIVPGTTRSSANILVLADPFREPAESFTNSLSEPSNVTIADGSGAVTISANCHNREPGTSATALDLGTVSGDVGNQVIYSPLGSSICGGETDWFKFRLSENDGPGNIPLSASIYLDLADGAPNGDLDLFVYYSDGTEWDRSQNFGTTDEYSRFEGPDTSFDDSDYIYIAVVGDPSTATNDYSLNITGNTTE